MRPDRSDDPPGTRTIDERMTQISQITNLFYAELQAQSKPLVYTDPGEPHAT